MEIAACIQREGPEPAAELHASEDGQLVVRDEKQRGAEQSANEDSQGENRRQHSSA